MGASMGLFRVANPIRGQMRVLCTLGRVDDVRPSSGTHRGTNIGPR
jgi:hypothetical protein